MKSVNTLATCCYADKQTDTYTQTQRHWFTPVERACTRWYGSDL